MSPKAKSYTIQMYIEFRSTFAALYFVFFSFSALIWVDTWRERETETESKGKKDEKKQQRAL